MPKLPRDAILQVVWSDGQIDKTALEGTSTLRSVLDRVGEAMLARLESARSTGERISAVLTLKTNFDNQGANNEVQDSEDPG